MRPDWDQVKDDIMYEIVREKFIQDKTLARRLLETEDNELVEGNTWGDQYWGVDLHTMKGQNKLGNILMRVRDGLKASSEERGMAKGIVIDDCWQKKDLPEPIMRFIEDWTKKLLIELGNWSYLYYSKSVAIMLDYHGNKYEIKPSAFGLPIDAQAVMEQHQKEMMADLEEMGCTGITCFGETD